MGLKHHGASGQRALPSDGVIISDGRTLENSYAFGKCGSARG